MTKKMIIYGVLLLLWLVACVVLYVLKLIDWIKGLISGGKGQEIVYEITDGETEEETTEETPAEETQEQTEE